MLKLKRKAKTKAQDQANQKAIIEAQGESTCKKLAEVRRYAMKYKSNKP